MDYSLEQAIAAVKKLAADDDVYRQATLYLRQLKETRRFVIALQSGADRHGWYEWCSYCRNCDVCTDWHPNAVDCARYGFKAVADMAADVLEEIERMAEPEAIA